MDKPDDFYVKGSLPIGPVLELFGVKEDTAADEAVADALTALVAPDGLVPSPETIRDFRAHLRSLGFEVRPIAR